MNNQKKNRKSSIKIILFIIGGFIVVYMAFAIYIYISSSSQ